MADDPQLDSEGVASVRAVAMGATDARGEALARSGGARLEKLDPALVARVRAAICAEIDREIRGGWSVPFNLDAVTQVAIRETLAATAERVTA